MREFLHLSIEALERLAAEHADRPNQLERIAAELAFRTSDRAGTLHRRLVQQLSTGAGHAATDALARQIREERAEYESFAELDQEWIRFMLDMTALPADNMNLWFARFGHPLVLAANDVICSSVSRFRGQPAALGNQRADFALFPFMIEAGVFNLAYGRCTAFEPFRFLHERLFGGTARPYTASTYAACALHPAVAGLHLDLNAISADACGYTSTPAFFPNRD